MAIYHKLVRDNIPAILDKKGVSYTKRVASPEEYKSELIKKLDEEVQEFAEAGEVEELADILEVVDAFKKLSEYINVEVIQRQKREDRGGFEERIILSGEK